MTDPTARIDIEALVLVEPEVYGNAPNTGYRPSTYLSCNEAAFLSQAFGSDVIDDTVTRDSFLEAFEVGTRSGQE